MQSYCKVFSPLDMSSLRNFHDKIFEKLKKEYIDTNKIKFEHHVFH